MTIKPLRLISMFSAVLVLLALPSLTRAAARIQPGTYTAHAGTMSFRFKVIAHTATDHCGQRSATFCFIDLTYPKVKVPCQNGQAEGGLFTVPSGIFTASGRFSYHQASPFISFSANANGSTISGTLREKDSYDDGTGSVPCDSGVVHWHASR